jgi:outer membrane receptor protein involved in Fe transport
MRGTSAVLALVWATALHAQDTLRPRILDPVVATAERTSSSLRTSTAAVTRLSAAELARIPRATLADLLRLAPGISTVDFDGLGFDPQLMVRGFYGGGEAEYLVVLVDGRPVSQLQTGVVAWDVLPPLAAIETIEVVRGGTSSLYGDAAIGGVINVITRKGGFSGQRVRWEAGGGMEETFRAAADIAGPLEWRSFSLGGGFDRTGGFRDHAERTAIRGRASVALAYSSHSRLALTIRSHWRSFDEPGPLLESLALEDRRSSDPLFRFDHSTDRSHDAALEGEELLSNGIRLSGTLFGELRNADAIRTLALAPGFGDTKERLAGTSRAGLGVQVESNDTPLPGVDRLVIGIEGTRGTLDSKYYRYASGTRSQYGTERGERGELDTEAASARTAGALYAQYTAQLRMLRLSLGARYDRLHERSDPSAPAGQPRETATHAAFSPKAGINLEYLNGATGSGNLYFTISRSFKAATLDQLYDLRNIPVPFPPFEIRTSNPELRPQHGRNLEAGVYQSTALGSAVRSNGSLSLYQMDMTDELDFDVSSFRYVNLGRSRHRGVEAALYLDGVRVSVFGTYTLQAATSQSGDHAGKRLKAIPRHTLNAGASVRPWRLLEAAALVTQMRGVFLDDANTVKLPNHSRVDAQLMLQLHRFGVLLSVRNLLGAEYSTSGFLDPSGSGEAYLYPAAGRVFELGIRGGW